MNIWQSYKQEHGCLVHFARLANALLKDEESARDRHVIMAIFVGFVHRLEFYFVTFGRRR